MARTGRPKITTADFPEDWKEQVLAIMKLGASRLEVYSTVLDISDGTFARLMREDEDFFRTIKKGERLAQAWWESAGRTQLRDQTFSSTLWYMNMKNRYGWADKKEIKQEISGQIDVGTPDPEKAAKFADFLKGK